MALNYYTGDGGNDCQIVQSLPICINPIPLTAFIVMQGYASG